MKPPTLNEVTEYMLERQNGIDPEEFLAKYNACGWVQGKNKSPIKCWKSCVILWEKNKRKWQKEKESTKQLSIIDRLTDRSWIN